LAPKQNLKAAQNKKLGKNNKPAPASPAKSNSITKFYDEYKDAVTQSGASYQKAQAGTKYDIGGGAQLNRACANRTAVYERPDEDWRQPAKRKFDCPKARLWRLLNVV